MIAYWKLDESIAGTYQDDFNGHDGTCAGECPEPVTGYSNGGQEFNGTNTGIDVPADTDFDWGPDDNFSIEFWMKTDPESTCDGNEVVIGRDDSSTQLHWWVGCGDGGQATFYLIDRVGTQNPPPSIKGNTDIADGNWHHIVAIWDAEVGEIRLYVDGKLEGAVGTTYTAGFNSPTAPLNIGWLNLSSGFYFDGIVDEIALYNILLYEKAPAPGPFHIHLPMIFKD
jgi:hypothetical protein